MENGTDNPNKERVINFALLIQYIIAPDGKASMHVESQNTGISDAEIILTVEAWLEKVKEKAKQDRMGGFTFFHDQPPDKDTGA